MRTIFFKNKPKIISTYTVAGPKESSGGLKDYIHLKLDTDTFNEETFEKAETKMLFHALKNSMSEINLSVKEVDAIIAGDLLNQIISATFSARNFDTGYLGIYNACATSVEGIIIGANMVESKQIKNCICTQMAIQKSEDKMKEK